MAIEKNGQAARLMGATDSQSIATCAPMSAMVVEPPCHNCGAVLHGPFCAACGQRDQPVDPSVREVLGEVVREISDLDSRILRSVRRLFLSPGFLTMQYLQGRRTSWMSPVRLYLLSSVLFFATTSWTGQSPLQFNITRDGESDGKTQQAVQELGFSGEREVDRVVNEALTTWISRAMFVLVPVFALLVSLVRRRARRNYLQHLIFAVHVHAAVFGAQAVAIAVGYLTGEDLISLMLGLASVLYALGYLAVALRTVYGGSILRAFADASLLAVGHWFITMLAAAMIVGGVLFWR